MGLSLDELLHFTIVCHAKERLYMPKWRRFLDLTSDLQGLGNVQAIDASHIDCLATSRKYALQTDYTFQAMKVTLLVVCESGVILDLHCSTKQLHATQIGQQVLPRNLDRVSRITADKWYDSNQLRRFLNAQGVETVIKHREFGPLDLAQNHLQD